MHPLPPRLLIKAGLKQCLLSGLSGLILGLCFLYPKLYPLAWVALVPFLVALQDTSIRRGYALGVLHGAVLFSVGCYWVADFVVTLKALSVLQGWLIASAYWFFCAQMTGILAATLRWVHLRSNLPHLLTVPVLGTVLYEAFPFVFPVDLGLTQSHFYLALQALDLTGVLGLNAILLLSNAVFFRLYVQRSLMGTRSHLTVAAALIAGWLLYGLFALHHWHQAEAEWPTVAVGMVQTNAPASIPVPPPTPGYSYAYPLEMAFFEQLAERDAELVIWPETRFKGYHAYPHVQAAFHEYIQRYETALLLQDIEDRPDRTSYNAVTLVKPSGEPQTYRKMKLIPFGEYLPMPQWRLLTERPTEWLFGEFYSPLSSGTQRVTLTHNGNSWMPLICYEVAFSAFVADGMRSAGGQSQFITVQSNDVWFGATRQPLVHLAASVLRSVENRVPLIHVINNGPSTAISPTGSVLFQSKENHQGAALLSLPRTLLPKPTVYNRSPYVFLYTLRILTLVLLLYAFLSGRLTQRETRR